MGHPLRGGTCLKWCNYSRQESQWTVTCDLALHRLICYINSTVDLVRCGYVGDACYALGLNLFADADWPGDRTDYKSTSGVIIFLEGPTTRFPLSAKSARQTITSFSIPESELVAANLAVRTLGIPFLGVCEKVIDEKLKPVFLSLIHI